MAFITAKEKQTNAATWMALSLITSKTNESISTVFNKLQLLAYKLFFFKEV